MYSRSSYNWIIVPTLALLVLSSLVFSTTVAVQDHSNESDKANSLLSILEEANATVVKVFNQLEAKGVATPQDSLTQYNQARLLASDAVSMMQAGNYSEASAMIIEALQRLRASLRIIYESVTVPPTEFEVNIEKVITLNSSINRFYKQLLRIENVTGVAKTNGFNTTLLEAKIAAARSLLQTASGNLDDGRLEAASGNVAEAKVLISELSASLSEFAVDLKVQRLSAYIEDAEIRLDSLRETAISVSNTAALIYVNQAETSLNSAKAYLAQELINQTLVELANSRDSELQAEASLTFTSNSTSSVTTSSLTVAASP